MRKKNKTKKNVQTKKALEWARRANSITLSFTWLSAVMMRNVMTTVVIARQTVSQTCPWQNLVRYFKASFCQRRIRHECQKHKGSVERQYRWNSGVRATKFVQSISVLVRWYLQALQIMFSSLLLVASHVRLWPMLGAVVLPTPSRTGQNNNKQFKCKEMQNQSSFLEYLLIRFGHYSIGWLILK